MKPSWNAKASQGPHLGFGDFHRPPDSLYRHQVQPFANQNGGIDDTLGRPGFPDGLGFLHVSSMQPARVRINMRFWWTDCVWLGVWKASCGHLVGFNRDCCTKNDQDQELCPPGALMNHKLGDPKIQSPTVSMQSRLPPCRHTLSCRSTKNLYVWSSGQPLGPFLRGGLQFMAFCWQNGAANSW